MRGVHAVILCWLAAPALSGCIRGSAPVATVQAPRDVDSIVYGQSYGVAPASAAMAYAAAPTTVRYVTASKPDARDKLRVVVFGQEGRTNTYAINAGDVITMPLIGSVPLGTSMSPGDAVLPSERWF